MMLLLSLGVALAADHQVVHRGDSVESIAASLGDPELAETIRSLNGLGPGEQPGVGDLLDLPDRDGVQPLEAQVLALQGSGTWTLGAETQPLAPSAVLPTGAVVCTGEDSFATVRLVGSPTRDDHDDLTLMPETCVVVESSVSRGDRRASLVSVRDGSISVRALTASQQPGSLIVSTASGVSEGEGGGYRVHIEEGATRTEAVDGEVAVMGAGEEVRLEAGYGSRTRTGEAPGEPVALTPAVTLDAPADGAPLEEPRFTWAEQSFSLGYRFEVAVDEDFTQVVFAEELAETLYLPLLIMLPTRERGLWWRVTAYDRLGFLGLPSEGRSIGLPTGVAP